MGVVGTSGAAAAGASASTGVLPARFEARLLPFGVASAAGTATDAGTTFGATSEAVGAVGVDTTATLLVRLLGLTSTGSGSTIGAVTFGATAFADFPFEAVTAGVVSVADDGVGEAAFLAFDAAAGAGAAAAGVESNITQSEPTGSSLPLPSSSSLSSSSISSSLPLSVSGPYS